MTHKAELRHGGILMSTRRPLAGLWFVALTFALISASCWVTVRYARAQTARETAWPAAASPTCCCVDRFGEVVFVDSTCTMAGACITPSSFYRPCPIGPVATPTPTPSATPAPTPTGTPKPTSTPTPRPTSTPDPYDSHRTRIYWTGISEDAAAGERIVIHFCCNPFSACDVFVTDTAGTVVGHRACGSSNGSTGLCRIDGITPYGVTGLFAGGIRADWVAWISVIRISGQGVQILPPTKTE